MTDEIKKLDRTGRMILRALQEDARLPFSEIGRMVGLTGPAVAERVKRMEEDGLIRGYHVEINPDKAGLPIRAFIRLRTPPERYKRVLAVLEGLPSVLECHHVTGDDAFFIRVAVETTEALEHIIASLSPFGETSTAVVLSSQLQRDFNWQE
ncbi:MAG: Lrp/AsnC family transcriptional regulator [Anaerolineae bacterium]|nr:Lrp/AsnC family transcriptional regulator [Anaerolineae bacterium]